MVAYSSPVQTFSGYQTGVVDDCIDQNLRGMSKRRGIFLQQDDTLLYDSFGDESWTGNCILYADDALNKYSTVQRHSQHTRSASTSERQFQLTHAYTN
jgi:hypothetical protein